MLTAGPLAPMLEQGAFSAVDGVEFWEGEFGDGFVDFGTFAGKAFVEVPIATFRIAADDREVLGAAVVFVSDASGNNNDIAGPNAFGDAVVAAELETGFAAGNAKHFVSGAVVMMKIINIGGPVVAPIVCAEKFLEEVLGFNAGLFQCVAINNEWNSAVRKCAVVLQDESFDVRIVKNLGELWRQL